MTEGNSASRGRMMFTTRMRSPEGESASEKHAYGCGIEEAPGELTLSWHEEHEGSYADIRLTLRDGEAVMHRTGDTEGHLRFVCGTKQPGLYHTPYGNFDFMTDTHELTHLRDEKGGVLRLRYDLYLGGRVSSTTEMELTWRR